MLQRIGPKSNFKSSVKVGLELIITDSEQRMKRNFQMKIFSHMAEISASENFGDLKWRRRSLRHVAKKLSVSEYSSQLVQKRPKGLEPMTLNCYELFKLAGIT